MFKIFVDVGHGASDSGAVSNGLLEKNINLTVALKLKDLLTNSAQFDVKLSRENDTYIGLKERSEMANKWQADYFISIHHNAANGKARGWEIIHSMMANKKENSKRLAEFIGQEFDKCGQVKRRTFSQESENYPGNDYYTVLRYCNCPCVITEYAFIDDAEDMQLINSTEKLYKEAEAIYKGLCNFLNIRNNEHWCDKYYNYLTINKGITIYDKRYDDVATRGDMFAMIARSLGYKE